jgi:hypothetical protein
MKRLIWKLRKMRGLSPRTAGYEPGNGPLRLGETDSTGHKVGYIDEGGCCWESEDEMIVSTAVGRCHDAIVAWQKGEGEKPNLEDFFEGDYRLMSQIAKDIAFDIYLCCTKAEAKALMRMTPMDEEFFVL